MKRNEHDGGWLDEEDPDPEIRACLTCHVEIDMESDGRTYRPVVADVAAALRTLALQLEEGKLDSGHHPINTLKGKKIGEVYLDFYGTM